MFHMLDHRVILVFMVNETNLESIISAVKARGLTDIFSTMLDVVEPFGALGAQLTYIAQPALSLFIPRDVVSTLAEAIETPEGIAALRQQLEDG